MSSLEMSLAHDPAIALVSVNVILPVKPAVASSTVNFACVVSAAEGNCHACAYGLQCRSLVTVCCTNVKPGVGAGVGAGVGYGP